MKQHAKRATWNSLSVIPPHEGQKVFAHGLRMAEPCFGYYRQGVVYSKDGVVNATHWLPVPDTEPVYQ